MQSEPEPRASGTRQQGNEQAAAHPYHWVAQKYGSVRYMAVKASIRIAVAQDAAAVRDIARRTWDETYAGMILPETQERLLGQWYAPAALVKAMGQSASRFYVAVVQGQACVTFRPSVRKEEVGILEQIHDHNVSELGHCSRTDTIFVVTAVVFSLVVLGINAIISGTAAEESAAPAFDLVLFAFIAMTLLLNTISVAALVLGRRTRRMLLNGLLNMYHDNEVHKYYDSALLSNHGARYLLFCGVIVTLALTAIVVPLIIRFL